MGGEDYGRIGLLLSQGNCRIGESADARRQRKRFADQLFCQPDTTRLQAVGFDPFRRHPRAGIEDFHQPAFARTVSSSASTRPVMRAESDGE